MGLLGKRGMWDSREEVSKAVLRALSLFTRYRVIGA